MTLAGLTAVYYEGEPRVLSIATRVFLMVCGVFVLKGYFLRYIAWGHRTLWGRNLSSDYQRFLRLGAVWFLGGLLLVRGFLFIVPL